MSRSSTAAEASSEPGLPVHPGRILRRELEARGITAHAAALALRVPPDRIARILAGQRGVTAETALRLGRFLGTGPQLWVNLQANHDLAVAWRDQRERIEREVNTAA
jgi:addiction module HigA family antidote